MSDSRLYDNATKTVDLLHRLLLAWLILCVSYAYLPQKASMPIALLPWTVDIPNITTRWAIVLSIFCTGLIGSALISNLRRICSSLNDEDTLQAIYTYPSVATLGRPKLRWLFLNMASSMQFFLGLDFVVRTAGVANSYWAIGLAFLYTVPFILFGRAVSSWQLHLAPPKLPTLRPAKGTIT
jgi:hypothetical protein